MKVDLAKDKRKIRRYILQRIKEYPVYENDGPGEDGAPIQLVTMGYYLEQTGYFALVFDTRPDADSDGEWTLHLNDATTMLAFPQWCSLIGAWYEGKSSDLVLPDGASCRVTQKTHTHDSIAQAIGEMLRDTMIEMRNEGVLQSLPLAQDAFLIIEEFDGHWSWPKSYKTRKQLKLSSAANDQESLDEESDEDRKAALLERTRKLPRDEQISFWISELDRRARGRTSELDKVFIDDDYAPWGNKCALDELERIGESSVIPLLQLVHRLSRLPEWDSDRPKRKIADTPMQDIAVGAIWKVRDIGIATDDVEELLHQIIRTACKINAKRKLWGIIPYHASVCLHTLFLRYPQPKWDPNNNRLKTPEQFQRGNGDSC